MEDIEANRVAIEARIQQLDQAFETGMRARGFDPSQAENVPLPLALEKLRAERVELIEKLAQMKAP